MFELEMNRLSDFAVISVAGTLLDIDQVDVVTEAMLFVPEEEHLVLDLSRLDAITAPAAALLGDRVAMRTRWSEVVIASSATATTLQLVMANVDRVVPVVQSCDHARNVLALRCGTSVVGEGV